MSDEEPISDSLRYRVLKDGKGRCALCGATRDETILDIDHIIPRSKGGKTVYENLQVLCAKCNRSKRNLDDTDFRAVLSCETDQNCLFCGADISHRIIVENDLAFVILDKYPVTDGHSLVIPRRHCKDYFDLTSAEVSAVNDLLRIRRKRILESDNTVEGFNVGVNCGEVAGQTILHCHIHLIPRRKGDVANPRGGVRGVIPSRMNY